MNMERDDKEARIYAALKGVETPEYDILAAVRAARRETRRPQRRALPRAALLAACLAAVLAVTALALSPTFREVILASLGLRAPYATQVLGSCEDQGITIEAQSALTDGRMTRLYFTVHDPSGVFFLEDTSHDLMMDFLSGGEGVWSSGGEGLKRLSYDPETQTGLYVYSAGTYRDYATDAIPSPDHAQLTMDWFTPGQRYAGATFFGPADENCDLPLDRLACGEENGALVLLPGQNPQDMDADEVAVSSMGFGEDRCYHIRVTQQPQVTPIYSDCPFQVNYWMNDPADPQGPLVDRSQDVTEVAVSGGWDLRLPSLTAESEDLLQLLCVEATYSVAGGRREGNWRLTVPIQAAQGRKVVPAETVILSRAADSPPPSGQLDEGQVAEIFLSPLGVTVDFVTPAGNKYPCYLDGEKTACAVVMADGTRLTPTYDGSTWQNRRGWIAWAFERPIDPNQAEAVLVGEARINLAG